MGPSLSLKHIWPSSLHCELTWHMPARETCIGKSTVFEGGFVLGYLSNVCGKWRTVAYPREKKSHATKGCSYNIESNFIIKEKCDNLIIDQLWCGEEVRHFLWQRKLWYSRIVLLLTETSSTLMVIISLLSPWKSVLGWQRFHIFNKLSFYSDFDWGSHQLTGQIVRLLCSPQPLDPLF